MLLSAELFWDRLAIGREIAVREVVNSLNRWRILLLLLVAPLILAGLTYANYQFSLQAPGGNDFLPRYLGSRAFLLEGTSPYDPSVSQEAQRSIYGRLANPDAGEDVAHFVYPMPVILFVGPFSLLPYPLARALWMTLLQICLPVLFVLGIQISRWRPGPIFTALTLLFSVLWYFGFRAMILGQFAVIEAVLIAAGLLLIQRQMDFWAGLVLALSIIKPQVSFLLFPLILLWGYSRRRWTLLASMLVFPVILVGGFMLVLVDWPLQWVYQVLDYPNYTYPGSPVSIIINWFPFGSPLLTSAVSLLLIGYLLWLWYRSYNRDDPVFQWTAAVTLLITQLISPRTATTNFLVLVPGLMLVFGVVSDRWQQAKNLIIGLSMVLLLAAPWLLFLATIMGDREHPIMHIPFPLLLLAALWWVRWWLVRPQAFPKVSTFN